MASNALRLRGGFIDFEGEAEMEDSEFCRRRSRATTLPSALANADANLSTFDVEAAYLSDLTGKLNTLWGLGVAEVPNSGDTRHFFGAANSAQQGADMSQLVASAWEMQQQQQCYHQGQEQQLPPPPQQQQQQLQPQQPQQQQQQEYEQRLLQQLLQQRETCLAQPTHSESWPIAQAYEQVAKPVELLPGSSSSVAVPVDTPELLTEGSIGHPVLCARPCLYFPSGQCANGNSCDYCHLPHVKRPVHLDKQHREMLQKSSREKLVGLLVPLLREKLESFDKTPESAQVFDRFLDSCGLSEVERQSTKLRGRVSQSDRSLVNKCRAMTFRLLLLTILRSALAHEPQAHAASEVMLSELLANWRTSPGLAPTTGSGALIEGKASL